MSVGAAAVRVFIVDAHPIFRNGMASCLTTSPGVHAVAGTASVADARRDAGLVRSHVVIVDAGLVDGHRFIGEVDRALGIPVVACSAGADDDAALAAVVAGASGVLAKDTMTPEVLAAAIRTVLHGVRMLPPGVLDRLLALREARGPRLADGAPQATAQLTPREQQVLRLIAEGRLTREIATELAYSERTVKTVLHDVVRKLGARSRSQAVADAVRGGLI